MLNKAISLKQKRAFKTRLIFILAQVYHELKNNAASALYAEVVKRNPDYEMAVQAKINRALAFSGSDNKSIKNQLLKMLKGEHRIKDLIAHHQLKPSPEKVQLSGES